MENFSELIIPRFLRYVRICTTSDRRNAETPSSEGQWELARLLAEELKVLGIVDAEITDHCYVLAKIPASPGFQDKPTIGFMAHLDTSQDASGINIKPITEKNDAGDTIIRSDGTTLLGADDKAGIAEIIGAAEYLLSHPEINHGPVLIIFSPDEETGKGLPFFPMDRIKALTGGLSACYTLDGGPLGELETECFNAIEAKVSFTGRVIHLGTARGKLANACLMAAAFAVMLPRTESPEATDGYYGYYCPTEISGNLQQAELEVFIRDFDLGRVKERAAVLETFARAVETQFPGGKVQVEWKIQYLNMKEKIDSHPEVLAKLEEAARRTGVEFYLKPIRGGTDGSRLTELGIPTPNIFIGGRDFHSLSEWVSVSDMETACRLVVELVRVWGA
ncbi:MAG: tripeptide aminopeptidase PepT [Treponema sp.]|jgi:tripeptide aminopeptidase|nr:tripeptide aminopeptidase PepT [Treponema sp.]